MQRPPCGFEKIPYLHDNHNRDYIPHRIRSIASSQNSRQYLSQLVGQLGYGFSQVAPSLTSRLNLNHELSYAIAYQVPSSRLKPVLQRQAMTHSRNRRFSPVLFLASGFGLGYTPFMPGTFGALWGLPAAWAIYQIPAANPFPPWAIQAMVIVAAFVVGVPLCSAAAARLGKKDPSAVVYDEIATMPIVFFLLPLAELSHIWVWIAGFVLHRIFDILKPPPARQLERLPTGLGIMADDAAAALYACGALHFWVWFVGRYAAG